jgi:hypothetical protein
MKITILSLAMLLLCCIGGYAQTSYSVKGTVADTTDKVKLLNTSVMVLSAKDSILQKFTRAGADGSFTINNLKPGNFIVVLSYPGYADYSDSFTLTEAKKEWNMGNVPMILKSRLLQDVLIKGQVTAIKIKGDTTEFNARAYVIQPNDKVEDLIKQFPGIQVDKDGKITAQGTTVNKVLVDGEEFFGDDPTLVTKNIRADMVDKVQLYDKKSDQADFTGIDDGQKTKTLNIKLKENKKTGYFGKVDAGVGNDGYFQGQGLYNNFNNKQKFSVYTTNGNTGKIGLNWQDSQKYGDSNGLQVSDDGGLYINGGSNDELDSFDGRYNGQGIPKALTGGLHYDNKWNSDKQSINANYKAGSLDVTGTSGAETINTLTDSVLNTTRNTRFDNYMFRQKLDFTYQAKLDSTSNLKIMADGSLKNNSTNTDIAVSNRKDYTELLNTNNRNTNTHGDQQNFNASIFYTKKLPKKGRTYSVYLGGSIGDNENKGYLKSKTDFYDKLGAVDSTSLIDQYKTSVNKNRSFNTSITYTEPLSKTFTLSVNYGIGVNSATSDRKTFEQSAPQDYDVLVGIFSNNFQLDQFSNQVGLTFNYRKNKTTLSFGTRASDVSFKQINLYNNSVFKRHFINWNPSAFYQLRISQQQGIYLSYYGSTNQPSVNQIQPVRDNNDPLNIVLGNDKLKPSFTNNLYFNYNSYKILTGQFFYIGGNAGFTSNQITNSRIYNQGTSTSQSINLTDRLPYNFSLYSNIGRKINKLDMNVGLNFNANIYKNYNYAQGLLKASNSAVYGGGIMINKYVQKKYGFNIQAGPTYNVSQTVATSKADNSPQINNNYGGFSARASFNVFLPGKFEFASDANYTYQAATSNFDEDRKRTIINANINRAFFKDNTLKLVLGVNDLLNQNVGFNTSTNGNIISQNYYTSIKRYFMVSVIWDFNKMGGAPVKK